MQEENADIIDTNKERKTLQLIRSLSLNEKQAQFRRLHWHEL